MKQILKWLGEKFNAGTVYEYEVGRVVCNGYVWIKGEGNHSIPIVPELDNLKPGEVKKIKIIVEE
jgi:hypothetical protein